VREGKSQTNSAYACHSKVGKRQQLCAYLREKLRCSIHQAANFGRIESERVHVANNVPKGTILVQNSARIVRDDSRPYL
jgi:hypothetical protein